MLLLKVVVDVLRSFEKRVMADAVQGQFESYWYLAVEGFCLRCKNCFGKEDTPGSLMRHDRAAWNITSGS